MDPTESHAPTGDQEGTAGIDGEQTPSITVTGSEHEPSTPEASSEQEPSTPEAEHMNPTEEGEDHDDDEANEAESWENFDSAPGDENVSELGEAGPESHFSSSSEDEGEEQVRPETADETQNREPENDDEPARAVQHVLDCKPDDYCRLFDFDRTAAIPTRRELFLHYMKLCSLLHKDQSDESEEARKRVEKAYEILDKTLQQASEEPSDEDGVPETRDDLVTENPVKPFESWIDKDTPKAFREYDIWRRSGRWGLNSEYLSNLTPRNNRRKETIGSWTDSEGNLKPLEGTPLPVQSPLRKSKSANDLSSPESSPEQPESDGTFPPMLVKNAAGKFCSPKAMQMMTKNPATVDALKTRWVDATPARGDPHANSGRSASVPDLTGLLAQSDRRNSAPAAGSLWQSSTNSSSAPAVGGLYQSPTGSSWGDDDDDDAVLAAFIKGTDSTKDSAKDGAEDKTEDGTKDSAKDSPGDSFKCSEGHELLYEGADCMVCNPPPDSDSDELRSDKPSESSDSSSSPEPDADDAQSSGEAPQPDATADNNGYEADEDEDDAAQANQTNDVSDAGNDDFDSSDTTVNESGLDQTVSPLESTMPEADQTVSVPEPSVAEISDEESHLKGTPRRPNPLATGSLKRDDVEESPKSPQSASSVESTTGMTTREGLEFARAFDADTGLKAQRSRLKEADASSGRPDPRIERLPESPTDRIRLLEAKVHRYREWYKDMEANYRSLRDNYEYLQVEERNARGELAVVRGNYERSAERESEVVAENDQLDTWYEELREKHKKLTELYEELQQENEKLKQLKEEQQNEKPKQPDEDCQKRVELFSVLYFDEGIPIGFLSADTVRWPAEIRDELAEHIAEWINQTHMAESPEQLEPLTAEAVLVWLGDGTIRFPDLAETIKEYGYVFRPDRFGQDIASFMRDHDLSSIEAMAEVRELERTRPRDMVARLLEEINELEKQIASPEIERQFQAQNDSLAALTMQLNEYMDGNERLEGDLKQCRQHGAELERTNSELRNTFDELNKKLKKLIFVEDQLEQQRAFSDDVEAERDSLKEELQKAQDECQSLEATLTEQTTDAEKEELRQEVQRLQAREAELLEHLVTARTKLEGKETPQQPADGRPEQPALEAPEQPANATPTSTPATGSTSASNLRARTWALREAQLRNTESYRKQREALRKKREPERQQRAEESELFRMACGIETDAPRKSREERMNLLRHMVAAA